MPGYYETKERIKADAIPIDNETKFAWDDDDYETYQEWHEYTEEELNAIQAQKDKEAQEQALSHLASLIQIKTEMSDKLGYLWNCTYVGDVCVSKEYVKDPDAVGTAGNPIIWKPGVQLIPNAFYIYNNVTYVYVGEASEAGNEFDYSNFEEM